MLYFFTFFFGAFTLQTPEIEVVARIHSKPCVIPLLESSRKPWPSIEPSLSFGSVRGISSLSLDNRARPNFKGIKRFESLQFLDPRESSEECTCGAFARCFHAARCIWHACRRYTITFSSGFFSVCTLSYFKIDLNRTVSIIHVIFYKFRPIFRMNFLKKFRINCGARDIFSTILFGVFILFALFPQFIFLIKYISVILM